MYQLSIINRSYNKALFSTPLLLRNMILMNINVYATPSHLLLANVSFVMKLNAPKLLKLKKDNKSSCHGNIESLFIVKRYAA